MAVLEVLHFPDPQLRKKAIAVEAIDSEIIQLAGDMLETMYVENGIGLAATQVNVQKRVIIVDLSEEKNSPAVLVNPEIISAAGSEETLEGCLSVPDVFETVERAERIIVRYLNLESEPIEQELDGLFAVCIQHEIDHLDGKLFIDYLSPLKRKRIAKRLEKQDKQEKIQAQAL